MVITGLTTRAHVRRVEDWTIEATLMHLVRITSAVYSPDRRWIVTATYDAIRIWEASTHECRLEIRRPGSLAFRCVLSEGGGGRRAMVEWAPLGLRDRVVRTPLLYPLDLLEEAEAARFGELTPDERDQFRIGSSEERDAYRKAWRGGHIYGDGRSQR
jgi:hypothetical protein